MINGAIQPLSPDLEKIITERCSLKEKELKKKCPVNLNRLRCITISYFDFSKTEKQGQLIVLDAVADKVRAIFTELHEYKFPIESIRPIQTYAIEADSITNNNTSAFNFRNSSGKTTLSTDSYGTAININPQQNPHLAIKEDGICFVKPKKGAEYLNRTHIRQGMAESIPNPQTDMSVINIFAKYGFNIWGGFWDNPIDWSHFQPPRGVAEWLVFMEPEDANYFFDLYIQSTTCPLRRYDPLVNIFFESFYKKDKKKFMEVVKDSVFWEQTSPSESLNSFLANGFELPNQQKNT